MSSPNLPRGDDASLEEPAAEADAVAVGCLHGSVLAGLRTDRYRFQARRSWSDYMEAPSASRIAIGVRGDGFDTYRYREIPYAGALLLAETPRTVIPDNFVDGVEAVFAEPEPSRLCAAARRLLESDRVEPIAAAGRARLMGAHLSRHRAETVLERLGSVRARRAPARAGRT
jgi:hypothetical protein